MSNEISRVYQFLANMSDWQYKADKSGDGTVIKAEFRDFMEENFDWESLEGWNGESSMQDDLINKFWSSIDTNRTGKITGTNLKNLNALDSSELENLNSKIEVYEILNEYTKNLQAPNVVGDVYQWKQSVTESLGNYTDSYIKQGGTCDGLKNYLDSIVGGVMNKTTAGCCAAEYLNSSMRDILKEYDYSYEDDTILNSIIDNYVRNLPTDITPEEILSTVKNIVDAYMASAGLKEDNAFDLSTYGYSQASSSALNDLQKAVALKDLEKYINENIDSVFDEVFEGMTFSSDSAKAEFTEALKASIGDAQAAFIEDWDYGDFENRAEKIKEFNLKDYVSDGSKTAVFQEYYSDQVNNLLDEIANCLAEEITQEKADEINKKLGINFYDASLGNYKLDTTNLRNLIKDLGNACNEFISNFISSGESMTNFDKQLKEFIESYLFGFDETELEELKTQATSDPYISNSELANYKNTCISIIAKALNYSSTLALGSTSINSSNYKDVINAYTDGNELMDDVVEMLDSIDCKGKLAEYIENSNATVDKENNQKLGDAAKTIAENIDNVKNKSLSAIINGKSEIQPEFGIDKDGNIVFQEEDTTETYNILVEKVTEELEKTDEGKKALETIGGKDVLKQLIQAAWISTYNDFSSAKEHQIATFISAVIDNIKSIMEKLTTNPEYLEIYTSHTSYADTSLTTGLTHYGTDTTRSDDETIIYKGGTTVDSNGVVHLENEKDDPDYQVTMNELLVKLIEKYPSIDSEIITSVFRAAQQEAIEICMTNEKDCPYGTAKGSARVEDIYNTNNTQEGSKWYEYTAIDDDGRKWYEQNSRDNDDYKIDMDQLVQLTLYCFDKLLYKQITK